MYSAKYNMFSSVTPAELLTRSTYEYKMPNSDIHVVSAETFGRNEEFILISKPTIIDSPSSSYCHKLSATKKEGFTIISDADIEGFTMV